MIEDDPFDSDFVRYLGQTTGLPSTTVRRLIQEVLAQYNESLDAYVRRRHRELQAVGTLRNGPIFELIVEEVSARRFCVSNLSTRQVRRIIYG